MDEIPRGAWYSSGAPRRCTGTRQRRSRELRCRHLAARVQAAALWSDNAIHQERNTAMKSTGLTRSLEQDPIAKGMVTVVPAAYTVVATGYAALAVLAMEHVSWPGMVTIASLWALLPASAMLKRALGRWRKAHQMRLDRQVSPIPGLGREHWALLEPVGSTSNLELGQVVLRRNNPINGLHVVLKGEVSESRPGVATLTRPAGTVLGDEQFIMGGLLPRTANYTLRVSTRQAVVWFIGFPALQGLLEEHPGLDSALRKTFLQNMGHRHRLNTQTDQLISHQTSTSTRALARMHSL